MALPEELAGKAPLQHDLHRSMVLGGSVAAGHPELGQVEQSELVIGVVPRVIPQIQAKSTQPSQSTKNLAKDRGHGAHFWA